MLLCSSISAQFVIAPASKLVNAGQSAHFFVMAQQPKYQTHQVVYLVGASLTHMPHNPIVPLMPDAALYASLVYNNTFMFQNTYGVLQPSGMTPFIIFPPRLSFLYGLKLYLAALLYDYTDQCFYSTPVSTLYIFAPLA